VPQYAEGWRNIMNKSDYAEYSEKMEKTIEVMKLNFAAVRAGRANASVLDQIRVDYYGTPTPINQIATISSPDPKTLTIQPWDSSTLKLIEKAIQSSDLGINPQNDGRIIRLLFPQLTEERRKELVKQVKKYGEESKVAVRNVRRDAVDKFKAQKKKSEITEDDLKAAEADMQKITDNYIAMIDKLVEKKEKELYEI
jgi:ribosome recycling factor